MQFKLNVANTKFTIPVGDTGLATELDLSKVPESVLAIALVNGFVGALNNIARSNGKGEEPKTNKQWAKARADKVAVWYAGAWASNGGGERDTLPMRDAFYLEQGANDTQARKRVDRAVRALVDAVFGEAESATFTRYLEAVATKLAKERDETQGVLFAKLCEKYTALALELVKSRQKAAASIDVSALI